MDDRKILVLTGASRGIGHATVKRFSSAGWRVITCSRHGFPENCPWEAGPDDHLQIDLASPDDVQRGTANLLARLDGKPLHALVNNAGISPKQPDGRLDCQKTPLHLWQGVSGECFSQLCWPRSLLALQGGCGSIVNVTRSLGAGFMNLQDPPIQHQRRRWAFNAEMASILASWAFG